jgi:hypothetical protein
LPVSRQKKLLGLALGEKSLLAAEVSAGPRPRVQRVAELVYPEGVGPQQPKELGAALAEFLKQNDFSAKQAVVGIPVKWLLVRAKDVPANLGAVALAGMLRLQAETEFSSELKDLVFDFAEGGATAGGASQVLLVATPRKYVEWATELCEAARLTAAAVTPSALALGRMTGAGMRRNVLVLMATGAGSELTAQVGQTPSAIRHLRGSEPLSSFVSELRRTVMTLPDGGTDRELVLWDGSAGHGPAVDTDELGRQLGLTVHSGALRSIGVDDSTGSTNGDGGNYAAAVALAVSGLDAARAPVDFLHSRLAPPHEHRVPRWAIGAAATAVVLVGGAIYAYQDMQAKQHKLDQLQSQLLAIKDKVADAKAFVGQMNIALAWHGGGKPRYLACLRDLEDSIPDDEVTYLTSFTVKEITATSSTVKNPDVGKLQCQLEGKTSDNSRALAIPDQLKVNPAFSDVTLLGTNNIPRERAVSFSISFNYDPTKAEP